MKSHHFENCNFSKVVYGERARLPVRHTKPYKNHCKVKFQMIALRYALLTGSDMSVINSGPKRNNYSDHSSYSYSGIGPKERTFNKPSFMGNVIP